MGQVVNTFTELNTDMHAVNTKPTVMTDAVNATLTTKGSNQLILQNMEGTHLKHQLTEGFQPLGVEVYNNIAYIVSGRFDDNGVFIEGEIGTYPSPDWTNILPGLDPDNYLLMKEEYSPLYNFNVNSSFPPGIDAQYNQAFRTEKLNLLSDRLIEVEVQQSYDDSVNIIFTDDFNPVRMVNSRFKLHDDGKKAALADRRQVKDTNTYSNAKFGQTKLIRQADRIPDLTFGGVHSGGHFKGGGYRFYFKYTDTDGALTDIVEESRLIVMGYGDHGAPFNENTGKYCKFTLGNIDTKFSGVRVYYSWASGETDTTSAIYEISNIYDVDGGEKEIIIYGDESTRLISRGELNLDYSSIDTVKTLAQQDDQLLLGNITSKTEIYDELRDISQSIQLTELNTGIEVKLGDGYADPNEVYFNLGYWAGETYEVGIVYILTNERGVTPAMPIRGWDNIDNSININGYSSNTPITTADGFIGAANSQSENRLGAYRTSPQKRMLTQSVTGTGTAQVRYFQVNMLEVNNNAWVQENTDGFFFVRKNRRKDCVVQGYLTNTCMEPTRNKTSVVEHISTSTKKDDWTETEKVHMNGIRQGIGKNRSEFKDGHTPKILPAPGRIWESTVHSISTLDESGKPLSMQGIVNPSPQYVVDDGGFAVDMYYAFYSGDGLVDPKLMASVFNGSNKGIARHEEPVEMFQHLVDSDVIDYERWSSVFDLDVVGGQIDWPDTPGLGGGAGDLGNNEYTWRFSGRMRAVSNFSTSTGSNSMTVGIVPVKIRFKRKEEEADADYLEVETFLNFVIGPGNSSFTGWFLETINYDVNIKRTALDPAATFDELGNSSPGDVITFDAKMSDLTVVDSGSGLETTMKLSGSRANKDDGLTVNAKNTYNTSTFGMSEGSTKPITDLQIRGNIDFDPSPLEGMAAVGNVVNDANPNRRNQMTYVGNGQNSYGGGSFSAVSDRNLYYASSGQVEYNAGQEWVWDFATTGRDRSFMTAVTNNSFSDYVGLKMTVYDPSLTNSLKNDKSPGGRAITTTNYFTRDFQTAGTGDNPGISVVPNGQGMTGHDLKDWVWAVQHRGIRLGVQANIYEENDGPISRANWKNRYSNTNTEEQYFAITKRYVWDNLPTHMNIDIFDGDCFIGLSYKRVMSGLGIPGVPTANDPDLYKDANRETGLHAKGFVFPLVTENNFNVAMRTFDRHSETEQTLYGKARSYFPFESVDEFRGSRQPESQGYNHGYDWDFSDRNYVSLNDRAPILDINFGNRVMVSKPSIDGNFKNGYNDFSGLNFRDYNKQLGQITKLITHNNYVYCIFEDGVGVLPLNQRTMVTEQTGGVFLDDAKVLAQKMQIISTEYGSDQQFSIIKTDGFVYGVDLNKNKIWRIVSQGGGHSLELISDFAIQKLLNRYKDRLMSNRRHNVVKTNYDRERNNVIFSFLSEYLGDYNTDLYQLEVNSNYEDPDALKCPADTVGYDGSNTRGGRDWYASPTSGELSYECCELIGGYWEEVTDGSGSLNQNYRCFATKALACPNDMIGTTKEPATYESASGQEVTQECCDSLGGYWDSSDVKFGGTCLVNAPSGKGTPAIGEVLTTKSKGTPVLAEGFELQKPGSNSSAVVNGEGSVIRPGEIDEYGNLIPVLWKTGEYGSVYFNETLNKWVSQLSWNPLFMFNIENRLFSFSATEDKKNIWEHFSNSVPRCNFYGNQDKFIFEFFIVDNPSAQKVLNNLMFICNRAFPGRITYGLIEDDVDYETYATVDNGYTELVKQRHEPPASVGWAVTTTSFAGQAYFNIAGYSVEESERLVGGYITFGGAIYIIGDTYENNGSFYNAVLNQNGISVGGTLPVGWTFTSVDFGIIKQNMEYIEDHLYVEVGKDTTKSRIRDKAIRVRVMYEGYDYVTIQSVISDFVYSYG